MTLRHHATLTADGRQAQAEVRKTKETIEDLGKGTADAGKKTDLVAQQFAKMQAALDAQAKSILTLQTQYKGASTELEKARAKLAALEGQANTTAPAIGNTGAKTDQLNVQLAKLQAELSAVTKAHGALQASNSATAKELDAVKAKLAALTAQTDRVKPAFNGAAGSVGNLTSQFNDIGVMLAAGQNPLQLAIQQGTQIGQVFQQSGAKGKDALKLIASGVTAMVSPVNLLTIGSIALGAAMTNWLMSSSKEAETLEDVLERLSGRVSDLKSAASLSASEVKKEFGSISPELATMLSEIRDRGIAAIQKDATAATQTLVSEIGQLGLEISRQARRAGNDTGRAALQGALLDLDNATTFDDQIRAIENLKSMVNGVAAGLVDASEDARKFRDAVLDTERALRQGQNAGNAVFDALGQGWSAALEKVREYGAERLQAATQANDMLIQLQEENNLRRIALTHGEESAQFADAKAAAERRVFDEMVNSLKISEGLKREIMAAVDEKERLASINIESGIWGAAQAASQLAANLSQAAAQKAALGAVQSSKVSAARSQIMLDTVGKPVERAGRLAAVDFQRSLPDGGYGMIASGRIGQLKAMESRVKSEAENAARLQEAARNADAEYRKLQNALAKSSGGGKGGKSRTEQEGDEVAELLKDYDQKLAILRETDPVQQELLRHSEALKTATAEDTKLLRQKIAIMQSEEAMKERIKGLQDFSGQLAMAGIDAMRQKGDAAAQAWQRVGQMVQQAVMQAAILGDGPLGGMLGKGLIPTIFGAFTGGAGGGLGSLFAGLFSKRADGGMAGGMTYGQGGSRDDLVPVLRSPLEFIVNASATARHRGLLEAINSGAPLPRFAAGGATGGRFGGGWADMGVGITINNNTGAQVTAHDDGRDARGNRKLRFEVADAVGQAMQVRGGAADRQMRQLGLKPRGPRR